MEPFHGALYIRGYRFSRQLRRRAGLFIVAIHLWRINAFHDVSYNAVMNVVKRLNIKSNVLI